MSETSVKFVEIKITLINAAGMNSYAQLVMVYVISEPIKDEKVDKIENSATSDKFPTQPQPNSSSTSPQIGQTALELARTSSIGEIYAKILLGRQETNERRV